jgi:hypothetical protein
MLDGLQSKDVEDCTPSQLHSQVSSQGVGQRSQSSQASSRAARSQQQLQGVQESTIQCSADECLDLLSSEAAIDDAGHHWRSIYSAVAKCPFYYCVETGIGQFVRPPSLTLIPRKNAGHAATAGIRVSQVLNGSTDHSVTSATIEDGDEDPTLLISVAGSDKQSLSQSQSQLQSQSQSLSQPVVALAQRNSSGGRSTRSNRLSQDQLNDTTLSQPPAVPELASSSARKPPVGKKKPVMDTATVPAASFTQQTTQLTISSPSLHDSQESLEDFGVEISKLNEKAAQLQKMNVAAPVVDIIDIDDDNEDIMYVGNNGADAKHEDGESSSNRRASRGKRKLSEYIRNVHDSNFDSDEDNSAGEASDDVENDDDDDDEDFTTDSKRKQSSKSAPKKPSAATSRSADRVVNQADTGTSNSSAAGTSGGGWSCTMCTYINQPTTTSCEMCTYVPPGMKDRHEQNAKKKIKESFGSIVSSSSSSAGSTQQAVKKTASVNGKSNTSGKSQSSAASAASSSKRVTKKSK